MSVIDETNLLKLLNSSLALVMFTVARHCQIIQIIRRNIFVRDLHYIDAISFIISC